MISYICVWASTQLSETHENINWHTYDFIHTCMCGYAHGRPRRVGISILMKPCDLPRLAFQSSLMRCRRHSSLMTLWNISMLPYVVAFLRTINLIVLF